MRFQDERRQEEAIPERAFVQKEFSFIKYKCLHKHEGSDYFSKKRKYPEPFFAKINKNTHMSVLSQGTDTVNKKSAVFTYVSFVGT